jgi:hypothetical protein
MGDQLSAITIEEPPSIKTTLGRALSKFPGGKLPTFSVIAHGFFFVPDNLTLLGSPAG